MPEPQPRRRPAAMPRFGARRRVASRREPRLPPPAPMAEPSRPIAPAPRRRWPHWQALSALLHAALLAALLFWPDRRDLPPQPLPPPSFDVVFEGAQPARPAEPPPGIELPPLPPPGAATPSLPQPAVPPTPPVAEAPPTPPVAAVPPTPPSPVLETPPPPAQPAPPPVPTPPRLAEPVRPPPTPPRVAAPALPAPPPPPPAPEAPPVLAEPARPAAPPPQPPAPQRAQPQPAPTPPARQVAPRPAPQPPALFLPDGFRLGEQAGRREGRGQAPAFDPRIPEGRASADPSVQVTGAQVGPDWRAAFRAWLDQNMRYPRRAAELGESGTVRVQVVAAPDGRVLSVRLTGPSASPSLNIGTTFPFSGARLPAFPPPADPNGVTIDLTVNYILIRR